jgi:hypothetical protein
MNTKKRLKKGKWYPTAIKPDKTEGLIVMTDMGYIFEAVYEGDKFLVSTVRHGKVYFEESIEQYDLLKWMRVI